MRGPWLFAGKTAPLYNQRWNGRRPELKYLTVEKREGGWGRSQRLGKCSQISDSQEPSPQREAIMVGRGVGRSGGACHQAYWQSVSKATGRRGGILLSRDGKMPARNKKSTLLRILGNERDVWDRRWWRGQQLTGQGSCRAEGKEFKKAFFVTVGTAPLLDGYLNASCGTGEVMFKVWWNERVR